MPTEHFKLKATIDIIERLKGGWERRSRLEDIRQIIDLLTEGHLFLGSSLQDGISFFRGRLLSNKQHFTSLKDLGLVIALAVIFYQVKEANDKLQSAGSGVY